MKILHIITGLDDGGAEAVLFRLCSHDVGNHHEVISLTDRGKYGQLLSAHGIAVSCLGMTRGRISLSALWRLWRLIRKSRPDAIQTWMYHSNLLGGVTGRLAGQRNISWGIHHTTLVPGQSPRSTIWVAKICARLSRIVPKRIVCCAEMARDVHAEIGYDRGRMHVVPNGYDLSEFKSDPLAGHEVRRHLSLNQADRVIGFVARFDPQKDHDTLLQALAVLKNQGDCPHCLLVGTGLETTNAALVARIEALRLQDRVHLLGRRNDIPSLMNALDLHVMSSAFGEAFPNVLAEAMACGTACVTTDVGDAAEIVGPTGSIVPASNPEALAAAIVSLLSEQGTPAWAARSEAARHRISDRYSIERMVGSYNKIWFDADQQGIDNTRKHQKTT